MRIGINASGLMSLGSPTEDIVAHALQADTDGFPTYWLAQLKAPDALTILALVGRATSTIELGTAVISTWLRHPLMLAAQALTTQEIVGGDRLILGIGLSHKPSVEEMLGIPFTRPARNMDEYLAVLLPVLADRRVHVDGEIWSGHVDDLGAPAGVPAPSVMVAAMGPRMLELAGSRTAGTILWLCGPRTVAGRIRPALERAADAAGRPTPRIVASVPVCVTDDAPGVRSFIAEVLARYNTLPSYREVMDAEGAAGPEDVSLVGTEDEVREGLARFAEAGATDFSAVEFAFDPDTAARTRALLRAVNASN